MTHTHLLKVQNKMQDYLDHLGINLIVLWKPDVSKSVHGEIKGNVILVYDFKKEVAWSTLTHEVVEYKLQSVTQLYRLLINNFIEAFEKAIYAEKEGFIDFLPKMVETLKKSQKENNEA